MLESSRHLFQAPRYQGEGGSWRDTLNDAIADCDDRVHLDLGALLSILSFTTFACGDATLLQEVRRQPWMSHIDGRGFRLESIPQHGFRALSPERVADELLERLKEEVYLACQNRKEIYVLLSGGLDSRIVAGVLALLRDKAVVTARPTALTWGIEDCRDVHYARMVAERLDFEWIHIPMSSEHLLENIVLAGESLGAHTTPVHLHRMSWLKALPSDAIVLAGSYGDSVGRAEYSGRHVLELSLLKPTNRFGLLTDRAAAAGANALSIELSALKERVGSVPLHVLCEYEQQAHYMRSGLAQTMSVIGEYCDLYQVFTSPSVYGFTWSIHPAFRTDKPYAELLERLPESIARIPWARTNRALSGKTEGASTALAPNFHQYPQWCRHILKTGEALDPRWYAQTGLFVEERVRELNQRVASSDAISPVLFALWSYMLSFRHFVKHIQSQGKELIFQGDVRTVHGQSMELAVDTLRNSQAARKLALQSPRLISVWRWMQQRGKWVRRLKLRRRSLRDFPPVSA